MPYFTTNELRALPDMADAFKYPDARLVAAHGWIESIIERECDTSFIARTVTETMDGLGYDFLVLSTPYILSATSITLDSVAFTATELAATNIRHGILQRPEGTPFPYGRANLVIVYQAGYSTEPPTDLKEAALKAARYWVLAGADRGVGLSARALSYNTDLGQVQLATAGEGRPTGIPDVDAVIMGWARKVRVPVIA